MNSSVTYAVRRLTKHGCFVQDGDIDMITTDHSPSTIDLKLVEEGDFLKAWGGISGIQVR
jgi:dihydroorotase-like cyclic amidohydrolase